LCFPRQGRKKPRQTTARNLKRLPREIARPSCAQYYSVRDTYVLRFLFTYNIITNAASAV
ncbi:MAG TPA: hypothetical protein PKH53_07155, partial [Candidatus Saccharicenans sp.]|nr:hypothetical protein [Candidatus Saccharicenans sp.]